MAIVTTQLSRWRTTFQRPGPNSVVTLSNGDTRARLGLLSQDGTFTPCGVRHARVGVLHTGRQPVGFHDDGDADGTYDPGHRDLADVPRPTVMGGRV